MAQYPSKLCPSKETSLYSNRLLSGGWLDKSYHGANASTLCWMLMEGRPLKPRSLFIPLGAFIPVTLATWSPVCSVAHLIEYPISSFPVLWKIISFSK